MSHEEAMSLNSGWIVQSYDEDSSRRFINNYLCLSLRPDWDGVITIDEGIHWALSHPGA